MIINRFTLFLLLTLPISGQLGSILPSWTGFTNFTSSWIPSFPSLPCVGLRTFQAGHCLTPEACAESGGRVDTGCLPSGQFCCIPTIKCGGTGRTRDVQLSNQAYPFAENTSSTCEYKLIKTDLLVSQLRIDFDILELGNPLTTDACDGDMLVIESVSASHGFPLCGNNTGSHMVIPFSSLELSLKVILGRETNDRMWLLHVRQLDFLSPVYAPQGCRQFYTERQGVMKSLSSVKHVKYSSCFKVSTLDCDVTFTKVAQDIAIENSNASCSSTLFFPPTSSAHGGFAWCMDDFSTDSLTVVGHPKIVYVEQAAGARSFSVPYTFSNC